MHLSFIKNKKKIFGISLTKSTPCNLLRVRSLAALFLFVAMGAVAGNVGFSDEEEKRRVDISLTIFPRIVAVDNNFRSKLNSESKVNLVFLYSSSEKRAQSLAESLERKNKNIGGMGVIANAMSTNEMLGGNAEHHITAIFLSERLNENLFKDVLAFAEKNNRIVFSPFTGDVKRGATVGISVTNRVKPYFNLSTLKKSDIVINALLIKMSKRYE